MKQYLKYKCGEFNNDDELLWMKYDIESYYLLDGKTHISYLEVYNSEYEPTLEDF